MLLQQLGFCSPLGSAATGCRRAATLLLDAITAVDSTYHPSRWPDPLSRVPPARRGNCHCRPHRRGRQQRRVRPRRPEKRLGQGAAVLQRRAGGVPGGGGSWRRLIAEPAFPSASFSLDLVDPFPDTATCVLLISCGAHCNITATARTQVPHSQRRPHPWASYSVSSGTTLLLHGRSRRHIQPLLFQPALGLSLPQCLRQRGARLPALLCCHSCWAVPATTIACPSGPSRDAPGAVEPEPGEASSASRARRRLDMCWVAPRAAGSKSRHCSVAEGQRLETFNPAQEQDLARVEASWKRSQGDQQPHLQVCLGQLEQQGGVVPQQCCQVSCCQTPCRAASQGAHFTIGGKHTHVRVS